MYTGPKLHTNSLVFGFDPNSRICNPGLSTGADVTPLYNIAGGEAMTWYNGTGTISITDTDAGYIIDNPNVSATTYWKTGSSLPIAGKDLTMTMWAKYTTSQGQSAHSGLSFHSHSANNGIALHMYNYTSSIYRIGCSTGNGSTRTYATYKGGTANIKDVWSYLALTYNNTTDEFKLYVNGVEETSFTYAQENVDREAHLFVWSTSYTTSSSYRTAYKMGLATVHTTILTADQLLDNFNATKHRYL